MDTIKNWIAAIKARPFSRPIYNHSPQYSNGFGWLKDIGEYFDLISERLYNNKGLYEAVAMVATANALRGSFSLHIVSHFMLDNMKDIKCLDSYPSDLLLNSLDGQFFVGQHPWDLFGYAKVNDKGAIVFKYTLTDWNTPKGLCVVTACAVDLSEPLFSLLTDNPNSSEAITEQDKKDLHMIVSLVALASCESKPVPSKPRKITKAGHGVYDTPYLKIKALTDSIPRGGTHASPQTHWRRGHLHLYWTGKGRTIPQMKLIKPILINGPHYGEL